MYNNQCPNEKTENEQYHIDLTSGNPHLMVIR